MSYTVLARRYRSSTFDELIGQEHIAQTLKKAIESGRIAHAYLFCGTRGTGKTSTARILAKSLNCQKSDKPTAEPCGKCSSCLAITTGDDMDVIEIDAASNTQVEKTREIIDNAQYRPAHSRFKIYIIDEVHMLSKSSFNALLKTLEEPPSHVKFILATTEPEKVLPTILSRCQRYDFRNIPTREIAEHLRQICKLEKIKADEDALLLIAKAGAGSMRDALSLLDRLLSIGEKTLTPEMIENMLGLPRTQLVFDLAQAIGEADVKQTLSRADKMISSGLSTDIMIGSLVDHLRNLLIIRTCGADSTLVEVPGLAMKDLQAQAESFDPVALAQDIMVLEELRRQMRTAQAARALLDAALVRLALAEQFSSIGELLSRANGAESPPQPALKKKYDEPVTRSAAATPATFSPPADEADDDLPRPGRVWDNSGPSLSELLKQRSAADQSDAPAALHSNVESVEVSDLPGVWHQLLELLSTKGPGVPSLLTKGRYVGVEDGQAIVRYAKRDETFVKMLERNGKKDQVRDAFSQVLQKTVGIRFEIDASDASEPAPQVEAVIAAPIRREVPRAPEPAPPPGPPTVRLTPELIESLRETEPLIRSLMDDLGAQIVKVEAAETV